jgi:hypothetical protein
LNNAKIISFAQMVNSCKELNANLLYSDK